MRPLCFVCRRPCIAVGSLVALHPAIAAPYTAGFCLGSGKRPLPLDHAESDRTPTNNRSGADA